MKEVKNEKVTIGGSFDKYDWNMSGNNEPTYIRAWGDGRIKLIEPWSGLQALDVHDFDFATAGVVTTDLMDTCEWLLESTKKWIAKFKKDEKDALALIPKVGYDQVPCFLPKSVIGIKTFETEDFTLNIFFVNVSNRAQFFAQVWLGEHIRKEFYRSVTEQ